MNNFYSQNYKHILASSLSLFMQVEVIQKKFQVTRDMPTKFFQHGIKMAVIKILSFSVNP
ncbi:MAG TPA: hypothetical protein VH396_05835 [Chitinophagaceae bacterium]